MAFDMVRLQIHSTRNQNVLKVSLSLNICTSWQWWPGCKITWPLFCILSMPNNRTNYLMVSNQENPYNISTRKKISTGLSPKTSRPVTIYKRYYLLSAKNIQLNVIKFMTNRLYIFYGDIVFLNLISLTICMKHTYVNTVFILQLN